MSKKKTGFTLVELSIALVIIGLLIGGILIGNSLIQAAQLNSLVSRFQQYDIAINNFKNKFKGLPGDSSKFQLSDCSPSGYGDGNGLIFASTWNSNHETSNVFYQLTNTKMLSDGKTYTACTLENQGPIFKFDNKILTTLVYGITSLNKNFYVIVPRKFVWNQMGGYNVITTESALALDQKMDDSSPLTGRVVARNETTVADDAGIDASWCSNFGSSNYRIPNPTASPECTLRIEVEDRYR